MDSGSAALSDTSILDSSVDSVDSVVQKQIERNKLVEGKKVFCFYKWNMKNEDHSVFFSTVNERSVQFVKVGRLINKVVKFVSCCFVLDVVDDDVQDVDAEGSRCKFLVKGWVDDSFEHCDHCQELVRVRNDLHNDSVNTE